MTVRSNHKQRAVGLRRPRSSSLEESVNAQLEPRTIDRDLVASLSRSYFTAIALLGDATKAEAVVIEAIDSLYPENVTSNAIRDAVVKFLVQAQSRE